MTLFLVQFSIEDLRAQPKQTACWDGVRNYQVSGLDRTSRPGVGGIKACFLLTYSVAKSLGQGCFFPEPKPENILTSALISLTARSFQMACIPASVLIQLWVKGKN